jgi:hypothetical protein
MVDIRELIKNKLTVNNVLFYLLVALCSLAFASIIYYQLTGLKADFYHESAFPLLYAQTNIETGLPYSPRFMGREIAPITWPLLQSIPLLFGAKVSITLHAITSVIFSFFALFACILFCRVNKFSRYTTALFLTLIFTSFVIPPSTYSWLDQVWVWPMNSYGIYDFFSLICLSLLIGFIDSKKLTIRSIFLIIFIFYIFGLNGTRSLIMVTFPVIFGLAAYLLIQPNPFGNKSHKLWGIVLTLSFFTILGAVTTKLIWHDIPQPFQDPQKIFGLQNREEFRDKIIFFLHTWLTLFNGIPTPGTQIFSWTGLVRICNSIFSILIILVPLMRLFSLDKCRSESITTLRFCFIFIVILLANVYGNASLSIRYLIPLAYSAIFIFPFYIDRWINSKKYGFVLLFCALLLPAHLSSLYWLTRYDFSSYKNNPIYKLSKFLENNGLEYGYGGPFDTNVLAVNHYSNSKVHIANIDIGPLREHLHADKHWYQNSTSHEKTFVAFPNKAWTDSKELRDTTGNATEKYEYEGWTIYVFPYDFARHLKPM